MSCLLSSGYSLSCIDSLGGVKGVAIATFNPTVKYTYTVDNDIDDYAAGSDEPAYYVFQQENEKASFNQTLETSENLTVAHSQEVMITMYKNTTALRNLYITLTANRVIIIVKDQNNEYWLVGAENGLRASAGSQNIGKAASDLNGTTVTFTGKERVPAYRISDISAFGVTL